MPQDLLPFSSLLRATPPPKPFNPHCVPDDIWVIILRLSTCTSPPPGLYQSHLEEVLEGEDGRAAHELLPWTTVSRRFSAISSRILYNYVFLSSFHSYEIFSQTILDDSSSPSSRHLGTFVREIALNFPERRLWGTHGSNSESDGGDGSSSSSSPGPAVGLPELLSLLPLLCSLGNQIRTISSSNFFQSLSLISPPLPLVLLHGIETTTQNLPSFISALATLSPSLEILRLLPSAEPSSYFPLRLLPKTVFPSLHTLIVDFPNEVDEAGTVASLKFMFDLLAHWRMPLLRQLQLGKGYPPQESALPDPTPFLLANGQDIIDFTFDLPHSNSESDNLVLFLLALPNLESLTVRPCELMSGGVAQDCLRKLKSMVVLYNEEEFETVGWVASFFEGIGRKEMPLLEEVVWESGDKDDDEDGVPCWKRMLRFGERLEKEGIKFRWV